MTTQNTTASSKNVSAAVATRIKAPSALNRLVDHVVVTSRAPASSVIGGLDYNWLTRTLRVSFRGGRVYEYRRVTWGVARATWKAADGAGSVGRFFNAYIRDEYPCKRTV